MRGFKHMAKWLGYALLVPILLSFTFENRINEPSYKPVQEELDEVVSDEALSSEYDLIVAGTDPEGIVAAVSAARNGLKVLLVDHRERYALGGLMTVGWLNTLDLNKSPVTYRLWKGPVYLNKGLFMEWYEGIRGTSFDVNRAANRFYRMVRAEPNIDLSMRVKELAPIMEGSRVAGVGFVTERGDAHRIRAHALIDATQDADMAVLAGAPYTIGREDIGEPSVQMAVTLVIKLKGVTEEIWEELRSHPDAGSDDRSIWGYQDAREYVSSDPDRVGMRNLNIGRQDGDTLLINSMQIYGVDPLDPESVKEAMQIGQAEAPRIAEFLQRKFEPFRKLEFAGTAPELYVRETRHIRGEYRLSMADLMENRDHWDAIAYGAYEVDIQSLSATTKGSIMMVPKQYGVPFRSLVPLEVDGLLVVGRSASFDTLPHGSARVIPLGMATGEAAGAAAKLAKERGLTFRELSRSEEAIAELRRRLTKQGMDLKMRSFPTPEYAKHKDYKGLLAATSLYLTTGGYSNEGWQLDKPSNPRKFAYHVRNMQKGYPEPFGNPLTGTFIGQQPADEPLGLARAAYAIAHAAGLAEEDEDALQTLLDRGWILASTIDGIADPDKLTNGDAFMLVRDAMEFGAGVVFE
ncbi:FAD-dependent oxidoreductase [Paenibacillaceae bacterium WGS1546]|uniref:FAD-dependent oxidoreductase n=1 Tax=Cohnella sp. WGS1546 TaxID=3366810 RepID=UPI00372CEDCF